MTTRSWPVVVDRYDRIQFDFTYQASPLCSWGDLSKMEEFAKQLDSEYPDHAPHRAVELVQKGTWDDMQALREVIRLTSIALAEKDYVQAEVLCGAVLDTESDPHFQARFGSKRAAPPREGLSEGQREELFRTWKGAIALRARLKGKLDELQYERECGEIAGAEVVLKILGLYDSFRERLEREGK